MFEAIYQGYQSGYWYNMSGHIGTLSTDVSKEDSNGYSEHSTILGNSNCDRKEARPDESVRTGQHTA